MKDREKLKKLVEIIGELLKVEGNEWLIDEILKTIKEISPIEEIAKRSLIQDIHEFCVEQKIEKQANEFYALFPIEDIRHQLIQDYKKMEHERRRDDFEGFSLCMFQQIEAIINYLYNKYIPQVWNDIKDLEATSFEAKGSKVIVRKSLSDEVMGDSNKWTIFPKYKAVLYYFYFKQNLPLQYSFKLMKNAFYELYQIRNKNHRQGDLFAFQKEILQNITGSESKYYFKFYGFLQDFVTKIESSLVTKTSDNSKKINKPNKPKNTTNTIGENFPELQKFKEQLKKNQ